MDANIYLGFFKLSGDDLEELAKLAVMVKSGDTVLYLPGQVRDEFVRNRAAVIDDSLRSVEKAPIPKAYPRLLTNLDGYKDMRANADTFEQQRGDLLEEARKAAVARDLHADGLISELFDTAHSIDMSGEIRSAAETRSLLGNPPGKKDSIGDAINWESLLESVPPGEDLVIVSADGDFASKLDPKQMDEFLFDEWARVKGTKVTLYDSLTGLFKVNYPTIRLAADLEKSLAIDRLIASPTFRSTHLAIQRLSEFTDFTAADAASLAEAAIANAQIRLVMGDTDVKEFYTALLDRYADELPPETRSSLQDQLGASEEY